MSLSPEGHVPEPEKKGKKMPVWVIVVIILAVILLVLVCCLITIFYVIPQVIDISFLDWLGGF